MYIALSGQNAGLIWNETTSVSKKALLVGAGMEVQGFHKHSEVKGSRTRESIIDREPSPGLQNLLLLTLWNREECGGPA